MYRNLRNLLTLTVVLWPALAFSQTVESELVLKEDDQPVYSLPQPHTAIPQTWTVGDSRLSIERHDQMMKFEAVKDDRIASQWVSDTDKHGRFIYNEKKHKFERLTHSVRITMKDYDALDQVVEQTDAVAGKAYPQLGFATLFLPEEVDQVEFVKNLNDRQLVETAQVVVESPPQIPM